jgi:hypothetical protein
MPCARQGLPPSSRTLCGVSSDGPPSQSAVRQQKDGRWSERCALLLGPSRRTGGKSRNAEGEELALAGTNAGRLEGFVSVEVLLEADDPVVIDSEDEAVLTIDLESSAL